MRHRYKLTVTMQHAISLVSNSVTFPALCVSRDAGVYLVRDLPGLRRSRAQLYWRYHHFDGLRIYDCEERAFEVIAASVSRPVSELGRLLARLLDLTITVDVEITPIGPASLSEVISAVQRAIEADPESFEELSERSIEWWHATLAHISSVQGVIHAFGDPQNGG
jgi:hypothetical protein